MELFAEDHVWFWDSSITDAKVAQRSLSRVLLEAIGALEFTQRDQLSCCVRSSVLPASPRGLGGDGPSRGRRLCSGVPLAVPSNGHDHEYF